MNIEEIVTKRSNGACELCSATDNLELFVVAPKSGDNADHVALLCATCREQISDQTKADPNHWRCLNDSMWSAVPAVQILAYRMLTALRAEGWPRDLLDMLYFEDDMLAWAKEGITNNSESTMKYIDANGALLAQGDSVTIIKDLKVKGGGFTAKRGTMVRGISLDANDEKQIEGRVNGQHIVIYTKFVKKA